MGAHWVVAAGLTLGLAGWLARAAVPAGAAPVRQGVACEWRELDSSGLLMVYSAIDTGFLVGLPGRGIVDIGGSRAPTARLLDLRAGPPGIWVDLRPGGARPGPVIRPWFGCNSPGLSAEAISRPIGPDLVEALVLSSFQTAGCDGGMSRNIPRAQVGGSSVTWCPPLRPAPMLQWPQATVYYPEEDSVIAVGHGKDLSKLRPDTFRLDLANPNPEWQALDATGGQPSDVVCCTTAVYDSLARRMILIGGQVSLQRVWMLDLASGFSKARWVSVETTAVNGYPEARPVPAAAFMPQFNWVVMFGGHGTWSTRTDTWILDLNAAPPEWRRLATTGETHQLSQDTAPNHAQVSVGGADVLVTTGIKSNKLKLFGLFCRSTVTPFQYHPQEQPEPPPSGSIPVTRGRLLAASGDVDLAVSRVETDGSSSVQAAARSRPLAPCVRNLGAAPAPRFTVRADDGVTWTAPGLRAGQELCLEPKASRGRAVTVDPDNRVREADEANNTRAVVGAAVPATEAR